MEKLVIKKLIKKTSRINFQEPCNNLFIYRKRFRDYVSRFPSENTYKKAF